MSIIFLYVTIGIVVVNGWQYYIELNRLRESQYYSKGTLDWQSITGQILTSTITKEIRTSTNLDGNYQENYDVYRVDIEYIYTVNGKTYDGRVEESRETTNEKIANDLARRFPVGSPITVYYDPQHPGDAVLSQSNGVQWDIIEKLEKRSLTVKICIAVIVLIIIYRILF